MKNWEKTPLIPFAMASLWLVVGVIFVIFNAPPVIFCMAIVCSVLWNIQARNESLGLTKANHPDSGPNHEDTDAT